MSCTLTSLQELDLYDVSSFDGKTLLELHALVCRKEYLESTPGFDFDRNEIPDLKFHGAPNEDLFLEFMLPGYPDFVLKPDIEDVGIDNLEEYISLVVVSIVKTGITRLMEAFLTGFSRVFDISSLQIFSPSELDYMLCGNKELWEADKLVENINLIMGALHRVLQ